jgi:hypothetical protein
MILDLKKCELCGIQVLTTSLKRIVIKDVPLEGQLVNIPVDACTDCREDIDGVTNEENI